jgi:hypothetical protein
MVIEGLRTQRYSLPAVLIGLEAFFGKVKIPKNRTSTGILFGHCERIEGVVGF